MGWKSTALLLACLLAIPVHAVAHHAAFAGSYEQDIPLPSPDPDQCVVWENCQEQRGISLVDLDIRENVETAKEAMEGEEDWALQTDVKDVAATSTITIYRLCWYTEGHAKIDCKRSPGYMWGSKIIAEIPLETAYLRVILESGANTHMYLRITTNPGS